MPRLKVCEERIPDIHPQPHRTSPLMAAPKSWQASGTCGSSYSVLAVRLCERASGLRFWHQRRDAVLSTGLKICSSVPSTTLATPRSANAACACVKEHRPSGVAQSRISGQTVRSGSALGLSCLLDYARYNTWCTMSMLLQDAVVLCWVYHDRKGYSHARRAGNAKRRVPGEGCRPTTSKLTSNRRLRWG